MSDIIVHPCKRGRVLRKPEDCIGCQGIDHRGNPRSTDRNGMREMEYQVCEYPPGDEMSCEEIQLGFCCSETCVKKVGGYVPWDDKRRRY